MASAAAQTAAKTGETTGETGETTAEIVAAERLRRKRCAGLPTLDCGRQSLFRLR